MFARRLLNTIKTIYRVRTRTIHYKLRIVSPVTLPFLTQVVCETNQQDEQPGVCDEEKLGHEFLIRQATTVNVNAATQLLTVTMVAIQDTSERLREALSKEICLVRQALEWGEDSTPPQHWDQLVAVRGALCDLKHNLRMLLSYMDYAEKLATVAAEISYLSGNIAASDAICERIDHACRQDHIPTSLHHKKFEKCPQKDPDSDLDPNDCGWVQNDNTLNFRWCKGEQLPQFYSDFIEEPEDQSDEEGYMDESADMDNWQGFSDTSDGAAC